MTRPTSEQREYRVNPAPIQPTPDEPAPDDRVADVGARLVFAAMLIGGFVGIYYHWHFTATWNTSYPNGDPNILGTGWILEAVFWALRSIPGAVLFGTLSFLGAVGLYGSARRPLGVSHADLDH